MKWKRNNIFYLLLLAFLVTGCKITVPKDILQPKEMEELLYDYHFAQVMSSEVSNRDNYKKQLYYNYVFEKHHTTQAQFDSSMVWYTRYPKELSEIYERLSIRLQRENTLLTQRLEQQEGKSFTMLSGDTVDLWYLQAQQLLLAKPLANKLSFSITADSTFYERDIFEWKTTCRFLTTSSDTLNDDTAEEAKNKNVYLAITLLFANDSVVTCDTLISTSGDYSLRIEYDSAYTVKELNGFIYYSNESNHENDALLLHHTSLFRYHPVTKGKPSIKP